MATKASPSSTVRFPSWQREYEAVLQETSTFALFKRVEVAEAAMRTRRDALEQCLGRHEEQRALENALAALRVLKSERLRFTAI